MRRYWKRSALAQMEPERRKGEVAVLPLVVYVLQVGGLRNAIDRKHGNPQLHGIQGPCRIACGVTPITPGWVLTLLH